MSAMIFNDAFNLSKIISRTSALFKLGNWVVSLLTKLLSTLFKNKANSSQSVSVSRILFFTRFLLSVIFFGNYSAPPSMMRVPTALIFHKLDFRLIPNQC